MQTKRCPGSSGREVTVQIGDNVQISRAAKFGVGVILGDNVKIGARSHIGAGCHIEQAVIGQDCALGARSKIRSVRLGNRVQIGGHSECTGTEIQDGVIIGQNFSLRGNLDKNVISAGVVIGDAVKIEGKVVVGNWVQIGDNTTIERSFIWSGALVIGGSTHIGSRCTIQPFDLGSGVKIGDDSVVYAATVEDYAKISSDTRIEAHIGVGAKIGSRSEISRDVTVGAWSEIGTEVIVRTGVVLPAHWLIPDRTIVNPGPNSEPVVIPKTT